MPFVVNQEELKKRGQDWVRGTVKTAVFEGEIDCPNTVVSSVYNTKPVHFISTLTERNNWVEITNKYLISIDNSLTH